MVSLPLFCVPRVPGIKRELKMRIALVCRGRSFKNCKFIVFFVYYIYLLCKVNVYEKRRYDRCLPDAVFYSQKPQETVILVADHLVC